MVSVWVRQLQWIWYTFWQNRRLQKHPDYQDGTDAIAWLYGFSLCISPQLLRMGATDRCLREIELELRSTSSVKLIAWLDAFIGLVREGVIDNGGEQKYVPNIMLAEMANVHRVNLDTYLVSNMGGRVDPVEFLLVLQDRLQQLNNALIVYGGGRYGRYYQRKLAIVHQDLLYLLRGLLNATARE